MVRSLILTLFFLSLTFGATPKEISLNLGGDGDGVSEFINEYQNPDIRRITKKLIDDKILSNYSKNSKTEIVFNSNSKGVVLLKLVSDVLEELGFKNYQNLEFTNNQNSSYKILILGSRVLTPDKVYDEFKKRSAYIKNVSKKNDTFIYEVNLSNLNLAPEFIYDLQKPQKPYFLNIKGKNEINIISQSMDAWHPEVRIFDNELNLLQSIREDETKKSLSLTIPKDAAYIQVGDSASLDNIKNGLKFNLK